jgi:pimeloyl-ACP methyl ester carboxylesterase
MKTYLLLHGAARGAWLWERIRPIMERAGATVIAYDLPGHGVRANERVGVNMTSYITDVLHYIKKNDLKRLILVGHSMSGIVVSRIAEEVPDRIRHLVYLAAVVPEDGLALIDLLTPERQESLRKLEGKAQELFGPIEALRPNYFTDQTGPDQDFFLKQLTPQPIAVFFEKITLKRFYTLSLPKTYIMGMRDKALPPDLTRKFAARLGVTPIQIDAGHDMMVVRPEETAAALLRIGEQGE